jgi:hypothetical protein
MKQFALAVHLEDGPLFSDGEVAILREEGYQLDEAGRVSTREQFPATKGNVRFGCFAFAKANNSPHVIDCGSSGWQAFRDAVAIRNRLVHPKVPNDLLVSDDDMKTVRAAITWFQDETKAIMNSDGQGSRA